MTNKKIRFLMMLSIAILLFFSTISTENIVYADEFDETSSTDSENLEEIKEIQKNLQEADSDNNLDSSEIKNAPVNLEKTGDTKEIQQDNDDLSNKTKDTIQPVQDSDTVQPQALYEIDGLIMNATSNLSQADPTDIFFFSPTSDRGLLTRLSSDNANYEVELYIVDWDSMIMYNTGIIKGTDQWLLVPNLPAGDYALEVRSTGEVGDNYNLRMNASIPPNYTNIIEFTSSLSHVVAEYADSSVYANGTHVLNWSSSNSNLSWKREFYFSDNGGYNRRTHEVYNVQVKDILPNVYSYNSNYTSSQQVLFLALDIDTGFMYNESQYQSGTNPIYHNSFVDTLGKKTPRRLDVHDFNYGEHILVFDISTGKTIDFFSGLNFYYAAGIEPLPTYSPR
ncbi:hypothetical protein [Oceanobacillus aidingensis]|uniref:Uncharacterized protein n=1 Tax=Oceanobacillus aidingensis TaxID=645964 RepID=A0ABV9JYK7_9BACI